jgi:hypothetical protein
VDSPAFLALLQTPPRSCDPAELPGDALGVRSHFRFGQRHERSVARGFRSASRLRGFDDPSTNKLWFNIDLWFSTSPAEPIHPILKAPLPPLAPAPIIQWLECFSGRTKNENESDGAEITGID